MRAAVFRAPGELLTIGTVDDPRPDPGGLILRVANCGICGSDLHMTAGRAHVPGGTVMGHEFSGEIVEVGARCRRQFREGQRVVGFPYVRCGDSPACRAGDFAFGACAAGRGIGTGQLSGAYAEYVGIAGAGAYLLPDAVSFEEGALVEPLAVGLHAVDAAGMPRGATVLIVGAGPVGLAVALWANRLGARHVIISERSSERRAAAARFGATDAIDPGQPLDAQVRAIAGVAADLIFECVGAPGLLNALMSEAPRGARIVVVGVCMEMDSFMPVTGILKELSLQFVLGYRPADFDYIIAMIATDRIDVAHMITDRVTLDELPAAFEALRQPTTQTKVMIRP